jgi:outer membrane receptor protein involved in Fe transport
LLQRTFWLATATFALAAPAALAQQPAPKPSLPAQKPAPGATVGEINVQGTAPPVRLSIDRQSYSVANDLQATSGSIGDALRNVPSLEVDVNGNVSLRGDSNVTIMVDGKPSGMFKGENKGLALQSLPADQIERVEVITNPSAAFDPQGSGGIINLVMKKSRKPGVNGSVRANLGSSGRQNAGLTASYRRDKLTLSGDASFRHDSIKQTFETERATFDGASGGFRRSFQTGTGGGRVNLGNLRGGLDYDPDAKTRLSLELRYVDVNFEDRSYLTYRGTSPDGAVSRDYDRLGHQRQSRPTFEAQVRFRRTFGEGHELTADFSRERNENSSRRDFLNVNRVPTGPNAYEALRFDGLLWETLGKVEYSRPLPGDVKLKLGYSYDADDNDFDNRGFRGTSPADAAPTAVLTNLFKFDQQVHAVYGTYERPFGKLTALAGLRVEAVQIDLNQVTQALKAENDDVSFYPSLHLNYELTEGQKLTASYSKRIQRPQPQDYNPFRIYQDPQNFRQGNPDLKPQETDSFELGYQYRKSGRVYLATLYHRRTRDAVSDLTRDIGGGIFLTTRANIGRSNSTGAEIVANGRLPWKVTYNVSANLLRNEIDGARLGFGSGKRSAYTASGRGSLSWQATDKDFIQLSGLLNAKRLTPQGYVDPTGMLNLGYRHKFTDQLSGAVTAQDVLGTFRFRSVIDTPALRDVQRFKPTNRGLFLGFTYAFGGGKARDPGFDFGQGGAPPGG